MQLWFARARRGASPYRLFALSNLASMLALVGYPFLLEPWAATRAQALGWSAGYVAFAALCAAAGWASLRRPRAPVLHMRAGVAAPGDAPAVEPTPTRHGRFSGAPSPRRARCCCSR